MNTINITEKTKNNENYVIWKRSTTLLHCLENINRISLKKSQKDKVLLLAEILINLKAKNVIIEWAHTYLDSLDYKTFDNELLLFENIKNILCENNICNEARLFIDDYTYKFQKDKKIVYTKKDIENYLKSNNKLFISKIELEGWIIILKKAEQIIKTLKKQWKLSENNENIFLKRNNILLFDKQKWKYSCTLLDAAFSLIKYQYWDCIINILPMKGTWSINNEWFLSYQNQQYKVRTVLREYHNMNPNKYPKFFNIYFDSTLLKIWIIEIRIWIPNFTKKALQQNIWEQLTDSVII